MTETVKREGKEYQIGKVYEFSDEGSEVRFIGYLDDVTGFTCPFSVMSGGEFQYCREIDPESLGKISKAKIEPEAGKVYKISNGSNTDCIIWTDRGGALLAIGWEIICEMVEKND